VIALERYTNKMGRARSEEVITTMDSRHAVRAPALSADESAIIKALCAEGQAPATYLRAGTGFSTQKITRALHELEKRGEVTRVFNAFGLQTPWWWQRPVRGRADFIVPEIERGQIWDWGAPSRRLWVEVKSGYNEFGLPRVMVKAGENQQMDTVLPLHYFGTVLSLRGRGEVSPWSAGFVCRVHGECTDEMVRTDKTCALCGLLLNRL
jgi:hypothetical protein